jgi:hypothetical protein
MRYICCVEEDRESLDNATNGNFRKIIIVDNY